jgi:tetratricopeptide (TPR) repeat protein
MITPAGDIKGMTIPWLFQDLRAENKTGTVMLSRDAEVKKVFFRSGEIIYASSNLDADQLGFSLMRAGKLTEEHRTAAEEASRKTGKALGAVLVERGLITPQDLVAGAKLQVKEIVSSLYLWRDGSYRFDNGALPLAEVIPLQMNTGGLLYNGLRDLDWKIVRKSLPPLKNVLRQAKDLVSLLHGIELDRDQQTVLALVNGERSIEEICALSESGDFITLKALYILIALRIAEPIGLKTDLERGKSAQAAPAEREEAAQAEVMVTREMIEQAYKDLDSRNYYDILGVGRNATAQEIKKSYFRLAKVYHPDRHVNSEFSDMIPMLERLFVSISEAYNVLNDDAKRDQYNSELSRGPRKQRPAEQRQDSQKGNASVQFSEGLKLFQAQNYWGAEEAFRWAMRLDPSNPDYIFHLGLALAKMPRRRHDAEEQFQKAIQMMPSKIDYYLELGNLYAASGLKAKALHTYQDALKRAPNSEKVRQAISSISGQPK